MALTRIAGYGHVALQYGLEESIFLESIMYWWRTNKAHNRNFYEGRWWTYNTLKALAEIFPWWSQKQVRRIADSCKEQGALLVGCFNEDGRDRTIWYSPSDTLLTLYGEIPPEEEPSEPAPDDANLEQCNCPNGQMHLPEQADSFAQMGTALPCNNHVVTCNTPYNPPEGDGGAPPNGDPKPKRKRKPPEPYRPDWFESFWKIYPRKDSKKTAQKAWDKLRPPYEVCVLMVAALEKAKRSRGWLKEGGAYIPLASTWINGERWKDQGIDLSQLPQEAQETVRGWIEDPEVIT